jgi:hypothetical protein
MVIYTFLIKTRLVLFGNSKYHLCNDVDYIQKAMSENIIFRSNEYLFLDSHYSDDIMHGTVISIINLLILNKS